MNEYLKYIVENQETEEMKMLAESIYRDTVLDYMVSVQPIKNNPGKINTTKWVFENKPYDGSGKFFVKAEGQEPQIGDVIGHVTMDVETKEVIATIHPSTGRWTREDCSCPPSCCDTSCCESPKDDACCDTSCCGDTCDEAIKTLTVSDLRLQIERSVIGELLMGAAHFSFADEFCACDIEQMKNLITSKTGKTPNWMISNGEVFQVDGRSISTGPRVAGRFEEVGMTVIVDSMFPANMVLMGYKGESSEESEYYHAPYKFEKEDGSVLSHYAQGFYEEANHSLVLVEIKR